MADDLFSKALAQCNDFVPALEMAILLAASGISGDRHFLANRLIDVAPDKDSMALAISAMQTRWGASLNKNISVCTLMAARVRDHDAIPTGNRLTPNV